MSVNAAGSTQNVQQALNGLRQNVQAEQVAAAALAEAAVQAQAQPQAPQQAENDGPKTPGVGENLDIKA
ncbi:MAG TPA: hypothetical protein VIN57_02345 [Magnetovibrio sp.]